MADQWRPLETTIVRNVLKNDSALVAAEEVICERINIDSTNKMMEWRVLIIVRLILTKIVYVSVRQ